MHCILTMKSQCFSQQKLTVRRFCLTFSNMQATLTSKGQITVPVKIRRMLKLKVGDRLDFDETAPFLKATKAIVPGGWDNFRANWKNPYAGMPAVKALEEMRGPVDLPADPGSSGR